MSDPTPKQIVEALLFASSEAISAAGLARLVSEATPATIEAIVGELESEYEAGGRAFEVQRVAGGFKLVSRPGFAPWIERMRAEAPQARLSRPALETLAIIAYKQPVARGELESIRGVSVDTVIRTLIEREMIEVAGRAEGIGRPLLYRTTRHFLEYFGLPDLDALPRADELEVLFADRERQRELPLEAEPATAPDEVV